MLSSMMHMFIVLTLYPLFQSVSIIQAAPIQYNPCSEVTIVSRSGWGAAAPRSIQRMSTPVTFMFIHHTATRRCTSQSDCADQVRSIQNYHMKNRGKTKLQQEKQQERYTFVHFAWLRGHLKIIFSSTGYLIVWQRFCEPARLRIAYCHGLNCLTAHCFHVDSSKLSIVLVSLLVIIVAPLPDKLSAEDRSFPENRYLFEFRVHSNLFINAPDTCCKMLTAHVARRKCICGSLCFGSVFADISCFNQLKYDHDFFCLSSNLD